MDAYRTGSLMRSIREVLSYLFLGLCAAYLYAVFIFRPRNPIAYPGVEDKLYIVLVMAAVATIVFYLPLVLKTISKARNRIRYSPIHTRIRNSAVGRAVSGLLLFLDPLEKWLRRNIGYAETYARINFYPGRQWFFATMGVEVFLVIMPLVLTNQKGLVEVSALLFTAYAIFSYVNRVDDRVMIVAALLFLAACPLLLVLKEDAKAELSAIYAYYALCTGVLLQFVDYAKNRDRYDSD